MDREDLEYQLTLRLEQGQEETMSEFLTFCVRFLRKFGYVYDENTRTYSSPNGELLRLSVNPITGVKIREAG